ncbi:Endonuclease, Uma2 family (restriction endonuclease fold) [Goodfellowiella coeruleoviolacea]|uniref:Endonuclease, Uma2 family (Restriction endonuclease fold) n=2 Tax=Goodfellowiella coeruleoviolacea TaxID=334858 RepID=A0AAE3KHK0_9PSEU|nr:Endonuclease, Uma2 family (restriction endonuclease fold) [Goodfellowiella coeruleoviolacea]
MTSATWRHPDRYTVDEWADLDPDPNGLRVELIDGAFSVTPAPAVAHQRFGDRLCNLIDETLWQQGRRELCAVTGIGVRVAPTFGFVPDIAVIRNPPDGAVAVPVSDLVLAVEIVSPSTRKQDRMVKPAAYADAGVPYYWRVEPEKGQPPTVVCFELVDGTYVERVAVGPGEPATIAAAPVPITLDVDKLYARLFGKGKPGR